MWGKEDQIRWQGSGALGPIANQSQGWKVEEVQDRGCQMIPLLFCTLIDPNVGITLFALRCWGSSLWNPSRYFRKNILTDFSFFLIDVLRRVTSDVDVCLLKGKITTLYSTFKLYKNKLALLESSGKTPQYDSLNILYKGQSHEIFRVIFWHECLLKDRNRC